MEYFFQFHWWYVLVGIVLIFAFFGKGKGGVVVQRFRADLEILDPRFEGCRPEADYCIFKGGKPDHIEIEIEKLSIPVGDQLAFFINGELLAHVEVQRDKEAEFDHWGDDGVVFPVVKAGDTLVIQYQNTDVLKGTFR